MCLILELQAHRSLLGRRYVTAGLRGSDARPGKLTAAPTGVWEDSGRDSVNPQRVAEWVRDDLGREVCDRIDLACRESLTGVRLLVTAGTEAERELLTLPWEVLESVGPPGSRAVLPPRVVRVLDADDRAPARSCGAKLKVAVLWADPAGDIPGLAAHLERFASLGAGSTSSVEVFAPVEFRDVEQSWTELHAFAPDVVYFVGHCSQEDVSQCELQIGGRDQAHGCGMHDLRRTLARLGPPALVVLNSCSTTAGHALDPLLGAARACLHEVEAVVSMQTDAFAPVTIPFSEEFIARLAQGDSLSEAMAKARGRIGPHGEFPFQPYTPVLVQRTAGDQLFRFDLTAREVAHDLNRLKIRLERVDPYLVRTVDGALDQSLRQPRPEGRVVVFHGASGTGKSTSVRHFVRRQLTAENYAAGERWFYHEFPLALGGRDGPVERCRRLVEDFSAANGLRLEKTRRSASASPANIFENVEPFVDWLKNLTGRKVWVCFDGLPADLCRDLAQSLSRVDFGPHRILLVSSQRPDVSEPLELIEMRPLDAGEVSSALAGWPGATRAADADEILRFSNGLPFFVVTALRAGDRIDLSRSSTDAAAALIEDRQPPLSDAQERLLVQAAYWEGEVPAEFFAQAEASGERLATALAHEENLLAAVGDGQRYRVPTALRDYLRGRLDGDLAGLRLAIYESAVELAEAREKFYDQENVQRADEFYLEAFRQALELARWHHEGGSDEKGAVALDAALEAAMVLHARLVDRQSRPATARAVWQDYVVVARLLSRSGEREVDLHRADCCRLLGEYDAAEDLLDMVTGAGEEDLLSLKAFYLHGALLKDRGWASDWAARIEKLREGLALGYSLLESEPSLRGDIQPEVAGLEHELGNALSYGEQANLPAALDHLRRARNLYVELGDILQYRMTCETFELRRYNNQLSDEERRPAMETLDANLLSLAGNLGRYDRAMHLYELGRLEDDPQSQAHYFARAQREAQGRYEPLGTHAACKALEAQLRAGSAPFEQVAEPLERCVRALGRWQHHAWSRRVRRNALLTLAEGYHRQGALARAQEACRGACVTALMIRRHGEGRRDGEKREQLAALAGQLNLHEAPGPQLSVEDLADLSAPAR